MFTGQRLSELEERKRLLVLQSDMHRGLLRLEAGLWRERLSWVRSTQTTLAAGRPLLLAGGVVAGVVALRHWRSLLRWAPALLTAWRWARRAWPR
jgi:hypothetical protein